MKTTTTHDSGTILIMGPGDIDQLPWQPVPGCPGVVAKDVWRSGDLHDALISYEPGSSTPGHPHLNADHHIWVVSGSASIGGRGVTAGTYLHIPPAKEHPITDIGEDGCVLLQMHRPLPAGVSA